jgi:hypothetical protein
MLKRSDGMMPPNEPTPTLHVALPPAVEATREAVECGRAERGRGDVSWSEQRALILVYTAQGMLRVRIAGQLGISSQRVTQLREEGCDAVLRGGMASLEAEAACADRWRRWCAMGDADACARVRHMPESFAS